MVVAALLAAAGLAWWNGRDRLPEHLAVGNGRIEAEIVHVAAKYPGRVIEVRVQEGDSVEAGQVVALMDSRELKADLARAEARVAQASEDRAEAAAQIVEKRSLLRYADREFDRAVSLLRSGHATEERVDERRADRDSLAAGLRAAEARQAAAARAEEAAAAEVEGVRARLDDTVLKAPRPGRVQYRLAEPGEVLAAGGRVLTVADLTDITMTIFLPTAEAGRLAIGSEARIVLNAAPGYVFPARVGFVADTAQFTPREVETRSERDKLMFRVKLRVAPDLLRQYQDRVKPGLPGEAYVLLTPDGVWPEDLAVRLPPVAR
ncbi:MAG: efflux RND transporter periplasmic adaptor subunit [Thalassobaculum sp.]|uniref:HlyD family secretion protein n=1 Tax=Thalassobaculum sp. TaxID=2022740 RepID=UPI0032EF0903